MISHDNTSHTRKLWGLCYISSLPLQQLLFDIKLSTASVWTRCLYSSSSYRIGVDCSQILHILRFRGFLCLQHYYVGENWVAAQIYWCITKRIKMLAAPRLFGWTSLIHPYWRERNQKYVFPRWRPNWRTSTTTMQTQYLSLATFATLLISHWSLSKSLLRHEDIYIWSVHEQG